jgi:asparagine synthase (glutamine-hydrolysing)
MWPCINPQDKMINAEHPMEKWVVRKAFEEMLPSVAWRQKNNLVMVLIRMDRYLKATVAVEISDEQLANAKYKFPLQTLHQKTLLFFFMNIFRVMPQLCAPHKKQV